MDAFPATPGTVLMWTKVREQKRSFSLGDGDREFAKITWPKALSNLAVGEWAGGRMILETKGIVHSTVTMTGEPLGQEIAQMPWNWRKESRVDFADGRSYLMVKQGFWNSSWSVFKEDGTQLLELKPKGFLNERGEITVGEAKDTVNHLAPLSILLWYSVTMASQQGAVAAAGGA